jgi:MFS family permease
LPGAVIALGLVSLLTDAASEMIFPLLPAFLAAVAVHPERALGWIEGVAEMTAALLKIVSGSVADRLRRPKPLVVAGYALAGLVRPLMALAATWPQVLAVRFVDRVGKGIRTSPRDALIAAAVRPAERGRAFGFHRALDNAGAVLGPLVAAGLLGAGLPLRAIFALTIVPGLAALVLVAVGVRVPRPEPDRAQASAQGPVTPRLGPLYWRVVAVFALFNLAASSDTFLLLRARDLGFAAAQLPLLWALSSALRSALATWGGALSDRLGRKRVLLLGWSVYSLGYLGFALARSGAQLVAVLCAYSLYYALVEGVERAVVADLAPAGLRGQAFGWFHGAIGLTALPASAGFGLVWDAWGAPPAFACGAALAAVAALALLVLVPARLELEPAASGRADG